MVTGAIVIFGASGGIGSALIQSLANHCIVCSSSTCTESETQSCINIRADIKNNDDVRRVFARTIDKFNTISAVVNCVGIMDTNSIIKLSDFVFSNVMNVNVLGLLHIIQNAVEPLTKTKGHFINIGSLRSEITCANRAAYCASKSAASALIEVFRKEQPSIHVCNIHPGYVDTGLHKIRKYPYDKVTGERLCVLSPIHVADAILFALNNQVSDMFIGNVFGGRDDVCLK